MALVWRSDFFLRHLGRRRRFKVCPFAVRSRRFRNLDRASATLQRPPAMTADRSAARCPRAGAPSGSIAGVHHAVDSAIDEVAPLTSTRPTPNRPLIQSDPPSRGDRQFDSQRSRRPFAVRVTDSATSPNRKLPCRQIQRPSAAAHRRSRCSMLARYRDEMRSTDYVRSRAQAVDLGSPPDALATIFDDARRRFARRVPESRRWC